MNNFAHLDPKVIQLAQRIMAQQEPQRSRLFPELDQTGFTAEAVELFHEINGTETHHGEFKEVAESVGRLIRRTDNLDALGVVGGRYAIAQNADLATALAEGCEAALPAHALQGIELNEHTSRGGKFSRIEYGFPGIGGDIRQLSGISTELTFKVAVTNWFGGGSIRGFAGAVDGYCTNGQTFGEFEVSVFRHTSGFNPARIKDFVILEAERFQERIKIWQRWARAEINPADAEVAFEAAGMSGRRVKACMTQLDLEAQQRGMTVWAAYSVLTFMSSHNSELFPVRSHGSVDNVAETLDSREREVARIIQHPAMIELGMAA